MIRRILLCATVVCGLPAGVLAQPAQSAQSVTSRTLVMPFSNVTTEGRIVWLGEGAAVLLTDSLNVHGAAAITREERREAFERLQVPASATLTDATVLRIAQLVGATEVVVGTLRQEGDSLVVRARTMALDTARVTSDVTEMGPMTALFDVFERTGNRLVAALPGRPLSPAPLTVPERPSIAAFENYIKGLMAGTPATALRYLTTALQLQPSFDRARLALWDVYDAQDAHDRALTAVQAVTSRSPWYRRASFLAGLSQLNLKRYADASATFGALADVDPTASVLNNLGIVQLRRPASSQAVRSTYYFTKATQADGSGHDEFFNLGYAYWIDRDTQSAIYWLREAVRRDPADGDAHFILGTALAAAGSVSEANREKELARRLSSTYAEWEKRPGPDVVPRGLERVRTGVELPVARFEDTGGADSSRAQNAQFYLDRAKRLYEQESDGDSLAELNRALFLAPYLADAHLLAGQIHLRGGRIPEAIDALKISLWSAETAAAHVALGQAYLASRNNDAARAEADRALALDASSTAARQLLDRLGR